MNTQIFLDEAFKFKKKYNMFLGLSNHFLNTYEIADINSIQMLALARSCTHSKKQLSVGEFTDEVYGGTNCSYNTEKLVKDGYLQKSSSSRDGRRTFFEPTEKGEKLTKKYLGFLNQHSNELAQIFNIKGGSDGV